MLQNKKFNIVAWGYSTRLRSKRLLIHCSDFSIAEAHFHEKKTLRDWQVHQSRTLSFLHDEYFEFKLFPLLQNHPLLKNHPKYRPMFICFLGFVSYIGLTEKTEMSSSKCIVYQKIFCRYVSSVLGNSKTLEMTLCRGCRDQMSKIISKSIINYLKETRSLKPPGSQPKVILIIFIVSDS